MNMLLRPWVGWYEAISDLLDDLPETEFAPWQLKRLPEHIKASALISRQGNNLVNDVDRPSPTLTSEKTGSIRAVLVGGGNTNTSELRDRPCSVQADPAYTVTGSSDRDRAYVIDGQTGSYGTAMTIRDQDRPAITLAQKSMPKAYVGRVIKLSPRCLARFNGLGDDYKLPTKQSLACKVLGNMVMPLVMKAIIGTMLKQD